ncbi:exodeoxyribonuclease V subunit gamma [Desertivirga arenae]|uniref:exodeoxyribonuclease V subunit gamma n=1 Tax=Desertivirga arenae TaxID=2810309 RepID=UPI001A976672|nr:exodeoxyribonuclease V subunit gamma [Pedobacter sp. SYSU D00823]
MSLQLKVSNSLANLAKELCSDLKNTTRSVFHTDYVITQTEGMNSWLKMQMADHLGIAANYQFLKPNDLIHQAYRILGGQYQQPLSAENQCWLLYSVLAEEEFIKSYPEVANYYLDAAEVGDLKRMALAEKVADLFDQYQIYRPEMISAWNQADLKSLKGDKEEWQQYIWVRCKELLGDKLPDKSTVGNFIVNALKDPQNQDRIRQLLPSAYIFGLSVSTAFHLQIFHELGLYSEIRFYLLNPAPSVYWFEDKSEKQLAFLRKKGWAFSDDESYGNALLTSWGKVIQNTFSLLFQHDDILNTYEELDVEEPLGDSLLHKIQQDIYHNRPGTERTTLALEQIQDGSLSIHSCYTPAREVEALYNYLVHLVDKGAEKISARDIVVMVTDVNAYAPYIRAVFDNAPYQFPYTVADESYTEDDTIAAALNAIFCLNEENFKAEEVLQVLDSSYVRNRFGITDLQLIRKVVNAAGIRFGIEGSREDDSVYLSWKYGLKRIIYGVCISGEEEYHDGLDEFYPLDLMEGQAAQELIRFCHFVEVLISAIEARKTDRSLVGWASYTEQILSNLIINSAEEPEEDYALLLKQLEKYNSLDEIMQEDLSYEVFSRTFLQNISSAAKVGSFAGGGITFCSLIPMRSIPFKIVALLGLNFDKFPRREQAAGFSLMEREKRKGDRNVKENDKHLFLETLLSARKYLYLSYIGQDVKDNGHLPPSGLIDELLDYIQAGYEGPEKLNDLLVIHHPLHAFSKKYNSSLPGLYDYRYQSEQATITDKLLTKTASPRLALEEISLDALIKFCKHPIKTYFNNVLSIRYESEESLLSDTEVFKTDHLQDWNLKNNTLGLEEEERDLLRAELLKKAALPLKNMSAITFHTIEETVAPVREIYNTCIDCAEEQVEHFEINFPEEGMRLTGKIAGIFERKQVEVCWSGNDVKNMLDAYIRYLAGRAAGLDISLHFISSAKAARFDAIGFSAEEARNKLLDLIKLYKEGHQHALCFWVGFKLKLSKLAELDHEAFISHVRGTVNHFEFPCDDPYILAKYAEGYFEEELSFELHQRCAGLLLEPLIHLFPDYDHA